MKHIYTILWLMQLASCATLNHATQQGMNRNVLFSLPTVNIREQEELMGGVEPDIEWYSVNGNPMDEQEASEEVLQQKFMDAIQRGNYMVVQQLLKKGAVAFSKHTELMKSPLVEAIKGGEVIIVQMLLDTKQYAPQHIQALLANLDKVFEGLYNINKEKETINDLLKKYINENPSVS